MTTRHQQTADPLTHPSTSLTSAGNRRNVAQHDRYREATIRGIPLISPRRRSPVRGG